MNTSNNHGIAAAGNTNNPCLLILRSAGYDLRLEPTEQGSLWCASKNGAHFMGHSGAELLGIVTLWERYGPEWNQQDPDVYSELVENLDER